MSTIVLVKKAGVAVIAADTMSVYGDTKVTAKYMNSRSKVLKCGASYIGVTGSAAHNNVLTSVIDRHGQKLSFNSTKEIFESYRKLHPILKDEYYVNVTEGDHDEYESSQIEGLIASPHGIFGMFSWREVYEYERFWAIGSGSEYALGAMYATYDNIADPEEIARMGMAASCEFDSKSGMPYTMQSVKLLKTKSRDG